MSDTFGEVLNSKKSEETKEEPRVEETDHSALISKLIVMGYDREYVEQAYSNVCSTKNIEVTIGTMEDEISRLIRKARERQRVLAEQDALKKEKENKIKEAEVTKNYTDEINEYLAERRLRKVHSRDLAEECWKLASETEKEGCRNNPSYFCYKCIQEFNRDPSEDKSGLLISKATSSCVKRLQESLIIDRTIHEYLEEKYPNRESDESAVKDVAKKCPSVMSSGDDRLDAYTVINYMRNDNRESAMELDALLRENEMIERITANIAANVRNGEAYGVAVEDAISRTDSGKKKGILQFTGAKFVDRVLNGVGIKATVSAEEQIASRIDYDTTTAELYKRMDEERKEEMKKYEQLLKKQEEKIKELEEEVKTNNEEMKRMEKEQRSGGYQGRPINMNPSNRYTNNANYYSNRYSQYKSPYVSQCYGQRPPLGVGMIAGIFYAILAVVSLLFNQISKVSLLPLSVGLILAAIGFFTKDRNKDYLRFIIIGHIVAIAAVVWLLL